MTHAVNFGMEEKFEKLQIKCQEHNLDGPGPEYISRSGVITSAVHAREPAAALGHGESRRISSCETLSKTFEQISPPLTLH